MSEGSSQQIEGFTLTELQNGVFYPNIVRGFVSMNDIKFYTTLQNKKI
jgi:hypothetical protein